MIVSRDDIPVLKEVDYRGEVVIPIDKPTDWTSFNVVSKLRYSIRNLYKVKKFKVGHAGTLDPLATGLLIICTGKMCKRMTEFMEMPKEYVAELTLGSVTPSYDLETPTEQHNPCEHIDRETFEKVLEDFRGNIMQTPPIYSAKQVNGRRAYDLARKGTEVKLEPCAIVIYELEILTFDVPKVELRVKCSKGTYIRSLAHDIGQRLGCGAHLSKLRRTRIGDINVEDALSIEEFAGSLSSSVE